MARERLPHIASIGRPMPFVEIKVVDEAWNELPPGEIGEGVIRSPATMSGYYGQPGLTSSVLRADGWLRTGDIMRMDEQGYFYLLSRKKDMIKSGGENVFTQEVEQVIRLHPAVAECVVVGVADEIYGEAVLAAVQLRPDKRLTLEELQAHCRQYISSYKKPRYLTLVDRFDMDDAGKIRKAEFKARIQAARETQPTQEAIGALT
ncbi:Long-chain-fatty-acid--CoA ligase [bioreactor metagenome]|uniref:Long-chain-fatty-acid--CoA ligase n=1 Tax=bioreactor metagenome TaxID=1076179 RepID=A0A645DHJ6_9ZZZZ